MQRGLRWPGSVLGVVALAAAAAVGTFLLVPGKAPGAASSSDLSRALALVKKECPGQQRRVLKQMWQPGFAVNALYGNCLAEDGTDEHIWFFDHGRFVGKDAPKSSHFITGLWRNDRTFAFMYVLYRQSDPVCCPTGGGAIVRFRWNGKHVRPLGPLPPRAYTRGVRVGR